MTHVTRRTLLRGGAAAAVGLVVAGPFEGFVAHAERGAPRSTGYGPIGPVPDVRDGVVRLDLPAEEAGDEPDERYRRAARTLAAWRSDGTFRKDPHPSIYVYEQTYCVPGTAMNLPRTIMPVSSIAFTPWNLNGWMKPGASSASFESSSPIPRKIFFTLARSVS